MARIIVLAIILALVLAAAWSSFHTVSDGNVQILLVLGEERQVLEPGFYVVPPFVSEAYPIDFRTMQYETPRGQRSIPSELRSEVELIATDRGVAEEARS